MHTEHRKPYWHMHTKSSGLLGRPYPEKSTTALRLDYVSRARNQWPVWTYRSEIANMVEVPWRSNLVGLLFLCAATSPNRNLPPSLCGCIDPRRVQSGNGMQSGLPERPINPALRMKIWCVRLQNGFDPNFRGLFCGCGSSGGINAHIRGLE